MAEKPGDLALESELLNKAGFSHAFFTRRGGASRGPFDSLNFALGTGDARPAVLENLRRAAAHLRISASHIYFLSQVHGADAVVLEGGEDRDQVVHQQGDVTVSARPGVGCGVRSADCATVLIADRRSGAVAAVHSGWRGTVAGVAGAGVARLRALSSDVDLVAAIGPHIEPCCFEVGREVAEQIANASDAEDVTVDRGAERNPHVDLRAVIRAQLRAAGLADEAIDDVWGCTMCDRKRFFSYRRDGKVGGRLLSCIVSRPPA